MNELTTKFVFDDSDGRKVDALYKKLSDFDKLGTKSSDNASLKNTRETLTLKGKIVDIENKKESLLRKEIQSERELIKLQKDKIDLASKQIRYNNLQNNQGSFSQVFGNFGRFGNIAGGVVSGGIAGGLTAGLTEAISLSKELSTALFDLGKDAITVSADFQRTTNSLAVFAGGINQAKSELKEISALASATTGLRLVPAEEGYQRLRALGFEANIAKGFIKELGEEKVLSGVSDEQMSKVLFNFVQIASGGQKVSQELREMANNMPTLLRAFQQAFGTLDSSKIQEFFDRDTQDAFQRLIDAMAKGKTVTGGFNDALGKLSDEGIKAQRTFGQPILEPLTNSVRILTGELSQNTNTWKSWGESVAQAISGINAIASNNVASGFVKGTLGGIATLAALPFVAGFEALKGIGAISDSSKLKGIAKSEGTDTPARLPQISKNKQTLSAIEDVSKLEVQASERKFKILEAQRESFGNRTAKQELASIKEVGKIREQGIQEQLEINRKFLDRVLQDNKLSDEQKRQGITAFNLTAAKLNDDLQLSKLATSKQIAQKEFEIEKEAIEKRKQLIDDFKRKLTEVKDVILSASAESLNNPYISIFQRAGQEIERVKELTKDFNTQISNGALSAVQNSNAASLFNQRVSTSLQVNDLQNKADAISKSKEPVTMKFADGSTQLIGDLETRIAYAQREMAKRLNPNLSDEQIDAQVALRKQVDAILNTSTSGIPSDIAKDVQRSRLADVFDNADPNSIPNELKKLAVETLNAEANARAQQEAQAAKLFGAVTKLITDAGLKVDFGNQAPFQIEIKGDNYKVGAVALPQR